MFKLTLREASTIPIDLAGVLPETMATLSALEAAKRPIRVGNRAVELGEIFAVSATPDRLLLLLGDCDGVQNIGAKMTHGALKIVGNVGRHAGAGMSGGYLDIHGDAGDWLGAECRGGLIFVEGSAASQVGAAYRGSRRGMTGGHIAILGNAGDEAGLLMRRGRIIIRGNCGSFAGASMIAGTIQVDGAINPRMGAGMKRGTIITRAAPSEPGFRFACEYEPQFLGLLNRSARMVRCYRGDLMTGGRGEIWHVVGD